MRPEQWQLFKTAAKKQAVETVPVALIVDSPWIPGYVGISHLEYYLNPEAWFQANLQVMRDFPEVIFLPSWWVEYGMAIEPSAVGSRIQFRSDQPPTQIPMLRRIEDVDQLLPVDPQTDGFMALAIERYRQQKQHVIESGFTIPLATARGPLCLASFLRGVTELMTDLVENPEATHRLISYCTTTVINWLRAQVDAIGNSVEGIFILDDIPGLLSRRAYLEFAHPYLCQITAAFPPGWVKVYHNDANTRPFLKELGETGFDVLNWTHNISAAEARERSCGKLMLMGNVAPLDVGVRGSAADVKAAAIEVLRCTSRQGIILSVGGGVSPGMPAANIHSLVEAVQATN